MKSKKETAQNLFEIANGEYFHSRDLRDGVEILKGLRDLNEYWRPWITRERIDEAVAHCKLAEHGVMDFHGLQDAAFLIADFAEWEHSKANALEFESRTQVQAMGLVEQVAASKGLKMSPWAQSSAPEWRYARMDLGGGDSIPVGASTGGVVSVNRDPYTPDANRSLNVTYDAISKSVEIAAERVQNMILDQAEEKRDIFDISITYEVIDAESAEIGDARERGYESENQLVDAEELEKIIQDYGFSEPSSSSLEPRMWFSTVYPSEDRDYFEKGEEKFYSLHLNAVNGLPPEMEHYAQIAKMAGVSVRGLDAYEKSEPEDDQPSP